MVDVAAAVIGVLEVTVVVASVSAELGVDATASDFHPDSHGVATLSVGVCCTVALSAVDISCLDAVVTLVVSIVNICSSSSNSFYNLIGTAPN